MLSFGALVPHPPLMVEGVGKATDLEKIQATRLGMQAINERLASDPPETMVVFTPHGAVFSDALIIYADPIHQGNLRQFGIENVWEWENDSELVAEIAKLGQQDQLPVFDLESKSLAGFQGGLDHAVLAPLSHFDSTWCRRVKLVVIPLSYLSLQQLYHFGSLVTRAADNLGRKLAVIASGDLSHKVAAQSSAGAEFDQKVIELLKQREVRSFLQFDRLLLEQAAECGFRSIIMLLGVFDGTDFQTKIHSYQAPFGVGYAVASFEPQGKSESLVEQFYQEAKHRIEVQRREHSPLVSYACAVVEASVKGESLPAPEEIAGLPMERAGVFVSLKKHGQLRGCIGTIEPVTESVLLEVQRNAVAAAQHDPRFEPVEVSELGELEYSVDLLYPAEVIRDLEELDPKRYGVIVSSGERRGLLLPNLEGIDTAAEQVAIAKQKAGIKEAEVVRLERFEVIRYY